VSMSRYAATTSRVEGPMTVSRFMLESLTVY
jgi:hypothetical protein